MNNRKLMGDPAILGGPKVRTNPFPRRRTMGDEEKRSVNEVLDSDVLSAFIGGAGPFFLGGKKVKEFEDKWKSEYGFKHAISINSWTSGLMVAIGAIGIEPGDEVICSPYSMSASATCALFYGGIPVFADIEPHTYCLSPESILSKITERTKAIIVVHLFGGCADMDPIMEIAHRYNLKVIEDAAQAPGVYYKGKPIGAIGDIGGFSLNFHKHIHTGEGGMLVTNNDQLALRAQLIRNHGENAIESLKVENISNIIGGNFRLTEIQAAIGIEQLKKLKGYLNRRNLLADYFVHSLNSMDGIDVSQNLSNGTNSYYVTPFKFDAAKAGLSRKLFVSAVNAELPVPSGVEDVPLTEGYVKPLYLNPIYQKQIAIGSKGFPFIVNNGVKYNYSNGICPITEWLYEKSLVLCPLIREPLNIEDVDDLLKAIKKVLYFAEEIREQFTNSDDGGDVFTPLESVNRTNFK